MTKRIIEELEAVKKKQQVNILFACESGSRAWGFPSQNSDYDVRFIYAEDLKWHLSVFNRKDTIDLPINDDLDMGGWEIKKTLGLLWNSNPPLLEWLQSPIIYHSESKFLKDIRVLSKEFYSPVAVMHHYLSKSKKYFEACIQGDKVKLKRYFYALRAAMAGKWVREKRTMPPIEIVKMLSLVDNEVSDKVIDLINIKSQKKENYSLKRVNIIDRFLEKAITRNEAIAMELPSAERNAENLDDFYRRVVKGEYW